MKMFTRCSFCSLTKYISTFTTYGYFLLMCFHIADAGTCKRIRIEGSTEHDNRMGVYFQLSKSRWCHERPSYKLSESRGTHYMYYNEILELNFEGWMIGAGLCENEAGLIAEDEAISPDKIKKKWQELVGGAWMRNKKIKSTCYNPVLSAGLIVAICIGIAGVIAVAAIIIWCFYKNIAKRNRRRREEEEMSPNRNWAVRSPRVRPVEPPPYVAESNNPPPTLQPTDMFTASAFITTHQTPLGPAPRYRSPSPRPRASDDIATNYRSPRASDGTISHYRSPDARGREPEVNNTNNENNSTGTQYVPAQEYDRGAMPMSPPPAYDDVVSVENVSGNESSEGSDESEAETETETVHSNANT